MNSEIDAIVERATRDEEFASQLRKDLLRHCLASQQNRDDRLAPEWESFVRLFASRPQELFKLRLLQIPSARSRRRRTTATIATLTSLTSLTVIVATPTAVTTITTLTTTTTTAN